MLKSGVCSLKFQVEITRSQVEKLDAVSLNLGSRDSVLTGRVNTESFDLGLKDCGTESLDLGWREVHLTTPGQEILSSLDLHGVETFCTLSTWGGETLHRLSQPWILDSTPRIVTTIIMLLTARNAPTPPVQL